MEILKKYISDINYELNFFYFNITVTSFIFYVIET